MPEYLLPCSSGQRAVRESEQAFGAFMEHRLAPVIQELGISGQPQVTFLPLHGVFVPALGASEQVSDL